MFFRWGDTGELSGRGGEDEERVDGVTEIDAQEVVSDVGIVEDLLGQLASGEMTQIHERLGEGPIARTVVHPLSADDLEDVVLSLSRVPQVGNVVEIDPEVLPEVEEACPELHRRIFP